MKTLSWLESVPSLWLQLVIVGSWLGIVVFTAEFLHLKKVTYPEIVRKVVHIGTGNVILLAWWLEIPAWVGMGAAGVAGAIALISYRIPILPGINSVGRKSFGTFFYAVSIGILIAWFWPINQPQYAAVGILVMNLGRWISGSDWASIWSTYLSSVGNEEKLGRFPDYVLDYLYSYLFNFARDTGQYVSDLVHPSSSCGNCDGIRIFLEIWH